MKTLLTAIVLLMTSFIYAQDCKGFYFFSNTEVQMTLYDKKGGENGKITYAISGITQDGNTASASFTSEMVNEKGKSITKGAGKYKCADGILYIDAKVAMPQEQLSAYKDMEVKADEVFIEYPASITAGQTLRDANFKMQIYSKGILFATTTFDQINRKVEGKETITAPAGTWECWKISYEAKFRSALAPMNIGIPLNMQCTEWFAPGFGIVKTETYNKNGKFMGSTLITSLKK